MIKFNTLPISQHILLQDASQQLWKT